MNGDPFGKTRTDTHDCTLSWLRISYRSWMCGLQPTSKNPNHNKITLDTKLASHSETRMMPGLVGWSAWATLTCHLGCLKGSLATVAGVLVCLGLHTGGAVGWGREGKRSSTYSSGEAQEEGR